MNENLKSFLKMAGKDSELGKKVSNISKQDPGKAINEIISLAKGKGIQLKAADLKDIGEDSSNQKSAGAAGGYKDILAQVKKAVNSQTAGKDPHKETDKKGFNGEAVKNALNNETVKKALNNDAVKKVSNMIPGMKKQK